jgi:pimeloyl-ACP methyl ester carboxylesterase
MKKLLVLFLALGVLTLAVTVLFVKKDIPTSELAEKYAKPPSSFVNIDGMQVHYRIEGEGMPLVLLHGTSSSLFTWDDWTDLLKDSYQVIRADLPGFGLTGPHPERDYSIYMYMQVLSALLDSLGIDTCAMAGNSLGGYVAWNYAAEYPGQVRKLILLNAVADATAIDNTKTKVADRGHSFAFQLARNPLLSWIVRWVTPKDLVESSLKEVYYDDTKVSDALVSQYFDMIRREGNRRAFIDNVTSRKPEGREHLLTQLQTPVLILWGQHDQWVDISMGHWFREVLPNNTMIVYETAGHVPMEEIPEVSAYDVRKFLIEDKQYSQRQ